MYVMLFLAAQTSQRYGISADLRELKVTSTAVAVKTSLKIEFASPSKFYRVYLKPFK